jgi:hypothetical protein
MNTHKGDSVHLWVCYKSETAENMCWYWTMLSGRLVTAV